MVAGLGDRRVDLLLLGLPLAAAELARGRRQQGIDPPAQLLGRLPALEAGQRLPARQRHHGGHRLDAEHLRQPRHHVDVARATMAAVAATFFAAARLAAIPLTVTLALERTG